MNTTHTDKLSEALAHISKASNYTEMKHNTFEVLEDNAFIESLARALMASLVSCTWLNEADITNNYSEVRGYIKDTLMQHLMNIGIQDLAAIEQLNRTWRKPSSTAPSSTAAAPWADAITGLIDVLQSSDIEPLEAIEAFVHRKKAERAAARDND